MPREPQKVTMWRTTDGGLHETETSANCRQDRLDMIERVKNQLNQFYFPGMLMEDLAEKLVDTRTEMLSAYDFTR